MDLNSKIDVTKPGIAFAMKMVVNNPFMQWNQVVMDELDEDHCLCHVELRPEQKNPNGLAHGGLLFTIVDAAASTLARADGRNYSTLDADVHYMRNVKEGLLIGEASIIRRGRTSVLVEAKVLSEEGRELVRATVTMFCIAPAAAASPSELSKKRSV